MNILVLEVNLKAKSPIFSFLFASSPPPLLFLSLFRTLGSNQCCRWSPPTPSLPSSPSTASAAAPSLSSTTSFPNSPPTASSPAGSTVRVPPTSSSTASSQPPPAPSPDSSSSPPFPYFFPKPSSSDLSSGLFFSPPPRFPASVLRCSRSTAIASSPSPFLLHLPIFGTGLLLVPPPSSDSHRRLHLFRRFDTVSLLSADDECRRPRLPDILPVGDLGVRKSVQTFRGFEARSPHSPSRRRRPPLRRSTTPTVLSLLLLSVLPHQHRRLLFSSEHHRPPPPFSSSSPPPPLFSAHRCYRCDLEPQPKPEIGGKKMALLGLIG